MYFLLPGNAYFFCPKIHISSSSEYIFLLNIRECIFLHLPRAVWSYILLYVDSVFPSTCVTFDMRDSMMEYITLLPAPNAHKFRIFDDHFLKIDSQREFYCLISEHDRVHRNRELWNEHVTICNLLRWNISKSWWFDYNLKEWPMIYFSSFCTNRAVHFNEDTAGEFSWTTESSSQKVCTNSWSLYLWLQICIENKRSDGLKQIGRRIEADRKMHSIAKRNSRQYHFQKSYNIKRI